MNEMKDKIQNILNKLKDVWLGQTQKQKKIFLGVAAGVLLLSLITVAVLYSGNDTQQVPLYTGLEAGESAEIYKILQDMGVPATLDSKGNILVDQANKDRLLLELSGLGYPKTALTYDIFSSNSSFTTTEFEKKQYLLFQLQDRIEKTLMSIDGVKSAIVTLDVPQESNFVWEEEANRKSSASILLELADDFTLSSAKISAIKNLVASSVPKMSPADVTIVDAKTSMELRAKDEEETGIDLERMDFEALIEQKLVDKVINVLSIGYDPDDIRVSATVVIDYKKMITEQMDYIPGENNQGVPYQRYEAYAMNPGDIGAQGVVGEQNNTDIPIYVDTNNDGTPEYVYHTQSLDYFVSYMKQQIEKDKAELASASLAITVKDNNFTPEKQASIIDVAAKATNIPPENITVANLVSQQTEEAPIITDVPEPEETETAAWWKNPYVWAAAGVLLLLIVAGIIFIVYRIRKKKQLEEEAARAEDEALQELLRIQQAAEEEKRKLRDLSAAQSEKDNVITQSVREFASEHPEITAALIRSWLREDD